ncbi:replication initiator [Streptomyces sp. NPDC001222]|uniref:replication initiator n=1 Tax=Streptomyces sp. NPDC001222 TaxID=3364548 RepID=UPI0036CFD47D
MGVPIHPGMVENLAVGTRNLYQQAEERLLGIIARQLAAGLDAPGWIERKLVAVQAIRRASQGVVDERGKAVTLEVFDVVAEAFNVGHRAAVAELGALSDTARRLVDDVTPNAQAVDRLAAETVDLLTERHRSILRNVDDRYRAIVAEVTATPLLGTGTRRMIHTAWALGALDDLKHLNLRKWAHKLGFRGHFSTKTRTYSTTLGALRNARAAWHCLAPPQHSSALTDHPPSRPLGLPRHRPHPRPRTSRRPHRRPDAWTGGDHSSVTTNSSPSPKRWPASRSAAPSTT